MRRIAKYYGGQVVIYYEYYADIPLETVNAFVHEREMGRLVTVSPEGLPHIGLYPFAYEADTIEMHLNRADEQFVDLKGRSSSWGRIVPPRCARIS